MQRPHTQAPVVSVIARLVLGLITCIRTEDITTRGRRTAGENRRADAIALEAQAGDNMIKWCISASLSGRRALSRQNRPAAGDRRNSSPVARGAPGGNH